MNKRIQEIFEAADAALREADWGGGFQTSREAQAGVQAGLKADAKKRKAMILSAMQKVIDGQMSKIAFKKLTGMSFSEMMTLPAYTKKLKMKKEDIEEAAYTPAMDYEGEMAMTQLKSVIEKANDILGMLKPEAKMEAWVQSKITIVDDYISSVRDYLKHTDGAIS